MRRGDGARSEAAGRVMESLRRVSSHFEHAVIALTPLNHIVEGFPSEVFLMPARVVSHHAARAWHDVAVAYALARYERTRP